jgi:uncharacterized protein
LDGLVLDQAHTERIYVRHPTIRDRYRCFDWHGFELAKRCAKEGYDLLIAADEPAIAEAATSLRIAGAEVEALQVAWPQRRGVDKLYTASRAERSICCSQTPAAAWAMPSSTRISTRCEVVIDTNVTGTVYLIHKIGNDMRRRNAGKILITGSIAGFMPGSFRNSGILRSR